MRKAVRAPLPIAALGIAILLALGIAALSQPNLAPHDLGAAALSLQITATPAVQERSEIGSTDGIMLMSIVIVLIVVVPLLLRRRSWAK